MENTKWYKTEEFDPQENTNVIITFLNEVGSHVGEAHFKDDTYYYIFEQEGETIEEEFKNVIAWTDMPKPYEEIKTYTEIQVEQIIADYERKLVDEVVNVRSEWEKKYNELLKINENARKSYGIIYETNQSLERKNKLLEEEMKHIEDDLTFFHGTEFDRDTELAEIVNSLILEIAEHRKKEKELKEQRSIVIPSSKGYEPSKYEALKGDNGLKVDEGAMVESIIPIPKGHFIKSSNINQFKTREPEFLEDVFNVMVIGKDLSVPQKEVVKVRMLNFGTFSKKYFQVIEGEYTGERFDFESGIKVK